MYMIVILSFTLPFFQVSFGFRPPLPNHLSIESTRWLVIPKEFIHFRYEDLWWNITITNPNLFKMCIPSHGLYCWYFLNGFSWYVGSHSEHYSEEITCSGWMCVRVLPPFEIQITSFQTAQPPFIPADRSIVRSYAYAHIECLRVRN